MRKNEIVMLRTKKNNKNHQNTDWKIFLSLIIFISLFLLFPYFMIPIIIFCFVCLVLSSPIIIIVIIAYRISKNKKDKIIKKLLDDTFEPIIISELAKKQKVSEKKVRQIIDDFLKKGDVKGTFTKDGSKFVTEKTLKYIFEEKIK